jgi:hypothetical protein
MGIGPLEFAHDTGGGGGFGFDSVQNTWMK